MQPCVHSDIDPTLNAFILAAAVLLMIVVGGWMVWSNLDWAKRWEKAYTAFARDPTDTHLREAVKVFKEAINNF